MSWLSMAVPLVAQFEGFAKRKADGLLHPLPGHAGQSCGLDARGRVNLRHHRKQLSHHDDQGPV